MRTLSPLNSSFCSGCSAAASRFFSIGGFARPGYEVRFLSAYAGGPTRYADLQLGKRGVPLQIVGAMVGHMSPAMVRYYTHISGNAARQAVEMLENSRNVPQFVDVLVDESTNPAEEASKLLN